MSIDIMINNIPFTLINIYAPNSYLDRRNFLLKISDLRFTNKPIFIGNFNQVNNPLTDRYPQSNNDLLGWEDLNLFKFYFQLADYIKPTQFNISLMGVILLKKTIIFCVAY